MRPDTLVPDPGDAHDWLRSELLHREYQPSLLERFQQWFEDLVDKVQGGPSAPSGVLLVVLVVLLAVGVAVVLSRLRPASAGHAPPAAVFDHGRRPAAEHRRLARAAYDAGRYDDAVVEGMRAVAAGLVERGVVPDTPGSTAHEVTRQAAPRFPAYAEGLERAAQAFDETRYGDRRATRERAEQVLALDTDLTSATPTTGRAPVVAVPR